MLRVEEALLALVVVNSDYAGGGGMVCDLTTDRKDVWLGWVA